MQKLFLLTMLALLSLATTSCTQNDGEEIDDSDNPTPDLSHLTPFERTLIGHWGLIENSDERHYGEPTSITFFADTITYDRPYDHPYYYGKRYKKCTVLSHWWNFNSNTIWRINDTLLPNVSVLDLYSGGVLMEIMSVNQNELVLAYSWDTLTYRKDHHYITEFKESEHYEYREPCDEIRKLLIGEWGVTEKLNKDGSVEMLCSNEQKLIFRDDIRLYGFTNIDCNDIHGHGGPYRIWYLPLVNEFAVFLLVENGYNQYLTVFEFVIKSATANELVLYEIYRYDWLYTKKNITYKLQRKQ